ncbi:chromate transporter [Chloroflexia bacterium SDU3-3]|nr:chromate transporter [Chloroflexia bacterium SDU3-3]
MAIVEQAEAIAPEQRGATTPTLRHQLAVWARIGTQSFGGGTATLFLIRQAAVERERWLTEAEFNRFWSICQISPGINLLGLTILIGAKLGGAAGVAVSLLGLMLPSVAVTIMLTAGYASIQQVPQVQSALRGIIPATVGFSLLLSFQMLRPIVAESRREGWGSLAATLALLAGGVLGLGLLHIPMLALLWGAGLAGGLLAWRRAARGGQAR